MMRIKKRKRGFRLVAVVRVLALAFVCLVASLVLLFQVSRARAGDVLTQLGAQLMRLPDARYRNGVQRLTVNGMQLLVQSGSSRRSPDEVLEQFYWACKERTGLVLDERQEKEIEPLVRHGGGALRDALDGIVMQRGARDSVVACIESTGDAWTPEGLTAAAQRLVESGDLMELGRLRYALVRPGESGGSVFLTMWTEGEAKLLGLFPPEGDAPGMDFPGIERLEGSRRFLSADLSNSLMVVYRHDGELRKVTNAYREALRKAGYEPVGKPAKGEDLYAFPYAKPGAEGQLLLSVRGGGRSPVMATLVASP